MFAGVDTLSERDWLARLDDTGVPIGKLLPIIEDREGYDRLLQALGPSPALIALEATGHYWRNLFAALATTRHDVVLLNPLVARRFQDSSVERTNADAIDAQGLARLAYEKRPSPTRLMDAKNEALREVVHHRDRIRQDHEDRVRQLHRFGDLGFPEFTRHVKGLDTQLATCLMAERPTARDFAKAKPRGSPSSATTAVTASDPSRPKGSSINRNSNSPSSACARKPPRGSQPTASTASRQPCPTKFTRF